MITKQDVKDTILQMAARDLTGRLAITLKDEFIRAQLERITK